MALLAAGCSDREASKAPAATPAAAPAASAAVAPAPLVPAAPVGAEPIDLALKAAQDFNLAAPAELAAIAEGEGKYRAASKRALDAARAGDGPGVTRRGAEADAAHKALAGRLAAFQTASAALTSQMTAAGEACLATPEMAAYAACVALPTEQTTLTGNLDAVTQRFEAAEGVWRQERAKLDEAAATVALGR
ncbi:MAG: hypothetical protein AB1942_11290 [Pseudomonadota bacterium]